MAFATTPGDRGNSGVRQQEVDGGLRPVRVEFAVTVHELHEGEVRRDAGRDRREAAEAGILCSRRRERYVHVKVDDLDTPLPCQIRGAVGGS